MKRDLPGIFLAAIITVSLGCAQTAVRTETIEGPASSHDRPKRVYALDLSQAWNLVLKGFNREAIPLEMVNQDTGLIRTEYRNVSALERKKCDLRFSQEPQRKTLIHVTCVYEGRREAGEPFRDFSYAAPQQTRKAEEEIYRKLEPYLLPFERTAEAQEELLTKGQPSPASPAITVAVPPEGASAQGAPAEEKKAEPGGPPPDKGERVLPPAQGTAPPATAVKVKIPPGETKKTPPAPAETAARERKITEETTGDKLTIVEPANARKAPSTRSAVITMLKKGETVEKLGESGLWTKVKLNSGKTAWVHRDFLAKLKPGQGVPPAASKSLVANSRESSPPLRTKTAEIGKKEGTGSHRVILVTKSIAKMQAGPSSNSKVIATLKKGRELERIEEWGDFTKVKLSWGVTGWVLTRSLQKIR